MIICYSLRRALYFVVFLQGKAKSIAIKLLSSAGTGFFYRTKKNPRNTPAKLALRKYDPVVQQHVMFNETKSIKR